MYKIAALWVMGFACGFLVHMIASAHTHSKYEDFVAM
jgi:hypothetical protein